MAKSGLTGSDATYQSVQERNIGFVFQHYALFKHMSVRQNIAFPSSSFATRSKAKVKARVEELLAVGAIERIGRTVIHHQLVWWSKAAGSPGKGVSRSAPGFATG